MSNTELIKENEYVDLGLPSGTLWKKKNEKGYYTFDEAIKAFGGNLPTKDQFTELIHNCLWMWNGSGYDVKGPNGNKIVLQAGGWGRSREEVGTFGNYWSSTKIGLGLVDAWDLDLDIYKISMAIYIRDLPFSVRLVK